MTEFKSIAVSIASKRMIDGMRNHKWRMDKLETRARCIAALIINHSHDFGSSDMPTIRLHIRRRHDVNGLDSLVEKMRQTMDPS